MLDNILAWIFLLFLVLPFGAVGLFFGFLGGVVGLIGMFFGSLVAVIFGRKEVIDDNTTYIWKSRKQD